MARYTKEGCTAHTLHSTPEPEPTRIFALPTVPETRKFTAAVPVLGKVHSRCSRAAVLKNRPKVVRKLRKKRFLKLSPGADFVFMSGPFS